MCYVVVQDDTSNSEQTASAFIEKSFKGPAKPQLDKIRADLLQMEGHWIDEAAKKLDEWENINAATHAAIVRHYGTYRNKKIGCNNWNSELLKPVERSLKPMFDRLSSDFSYTILGDIAHGIGQNIEGLMQKLQSKSKVPR
jgi:hypothetical protein